MHETPGALIDRRCCELGLGGLLCLAALAACGERKPNEIERAPRADPTLPAGKPALPPTDSPARPTESPARDKPADATRPSQPPDASPRNAYHPAPRDTVGPVVYNGWKQFNLYCARCHGEDATGTTIAPYLIDSFRSGKVNHDEFRRVVHGSRASKGMPNWTGILDDDKLEAVYEYLRARSEGRVRPGRPASHRADPRTGFD